jgi:hypothetical protein
MRDQVRSEPSMLQNIAGIEMFSPVVREVIGHLCQSDCHDYGMVVEVCESRGDCVSIVHCPNCSRHFLVDEDELAELQRWTDDQGRALVCGVQWQ